MEIDLFERASFAALLCIAAVDPGGWWLWSCGVLEVGIIALELWGRSLRAKRDKAESDLCWKGL